MSIAYSFPFSNLTDDEFNDVFTYSNVINNLPNLDLKKILTDTLTDDITDAMEFKYYTPIQLDALASKHKEYTQLSMFHVNIRSLNANYSKLINFLYSLSFNFDVIILSEIWATNLMFYINLLSNYDFFYELPTNTVESVVLASMLKNPLMLLELINM